MNPSEIIVLLLLAAAIVAVIRRNRRKGVPCECGGSCGGSCHGACASCRRGRSGRCPVARAAGILASPNAERPREPGLRADGAR